ncbi:RNA polymerase beta subunit [Pseudomonas phage PhiPA3]|uniref:Putative RNA polymerase beta subunit n=1 Tax=Pseudomonas phage PhiPA3 TaxID=998086 RepID=F8SJ55_BPPA3|nr:RNA polymerase beta subunit [Pseudomonas phage PhiPA3]AEH03635.1 putative RNA polymerase beta subunit [Pseudomonas phage PhiPA3]
MRKALVPFNIDLLIPTKAQLLRVGQVTSHEIFEGTGGNFHEKGLFSVEIFGRVGSKQREGNFGYIHLGLDIIHPVIYRNLIKLRAFYEEIILGKAFAVFDPIGRDFARSNELEGQTGYTFFFNNWRKIEFGGTKSGIRLNRLQLIEKYKDRCIMQDVLVVPAAYREAEIDADGRVSMDEINEKYRYLLNQSFGVPEFFGPNDDLSIYDRKRVAMQNTVLEIYGHFERLISGKGGYIQSKWASRRVQNGTRNVISSLDTNAADLDAPNRPRFKDAVVGLYQGAVSVKPKTIFHLRNSVVGEIFDSISNRVELVNKKTLKREWVDITAEDLDTWGTPEGLERVINELKVIDQRSRPIEIADHYLALVYLDDQQNYKIFRDIEDLPKDRHKKFVRPITYSELVYLAGLPMWYKNSAFVTRYPVENYNSSIPMKMYVKTTVKGEMRYPLDYNWERDLTAQPAIEYPVFELNEIAQWHDSTSVSPAVLAPLTADFDGDTVSFNAVYSKEAIEESDKFFKSRLAYIKAGGGLAFSINIHTLNLTLRYMTGDPVARD